VTYSRSSDDIEQAEIVGVDGFLKRLIAAVAEERGLIAKQTRNSHVRRRTEI
jgi:hypothetical protein